MAKKPQVSKSSEASNKTQPKNSKPAQNASKPNQNTKQPVKVITAPVKLNKKSKKVVEYEEEDLDDDDDDDEEEEETEEEDEDDEGDDDEEDEEIDAEEDENDEGDEEDDEEEEEDEEFEVQSSDDDESILDTEESETSDVDEEEQLRNLEEQKRFWEVGRTRDKAIQEAKKKGELQVQQYMHMDDLSSDDEADPNANTIGRVPLHWYDAFDHIGYNVSGEKIQKRKGMDRIDMALQNKDDPMAMRKIYDMYNDREVILTDRELEIIRRIQAGAFAHAEFNDTPDYVDYFSSQKELMPLSAAPTPKASFLPSKWEMMKVMKIVKAMKEGRYQSQKEDSSDKSNKEENYLIWNDAEDDILAESKRYKFHLPAPKMPLPGHAESYNPPEEYLLNDEEYKAYLEMDPEDRPLNFIPKKHSCLRHVGGYDQFVKERYERCLDLYLCPRKLKQRLNIDPESLVPKLPNPKELKPFPNTLCLQFLGHTKAVRCLAVSSDGQYLASGSDDGTVRLWEVDTCLCKYVWDLKAGPVVSLSWNPDPSHHLLVVGAGSTIVLITTGTGDADSLEVTESQLANILELAQKDKAVDDDEEEDIDEDDEEEGKSKSNKMKDALWTLRKDNILIEEKGVKVGPRVELTFKTPISTVTWHHKGDYLAVLAPAEGAKAISVHQISKGQSQFPFAKSPGAVQSVAFHPFLPCLIVVTQQHIKLYHLIEQKLIKKLLSGCKMLSSSDIHSSGDHIIVGSYDRRVVWFDLDLSSTPYKTLKFHEKAVRDVKFHKRYPLFASASDDGSVHIFHCMVYSDLMRNPLLVPLKVLKGHGVVGQLGVLNILFHPRQPWIFSAGADGVINLYQDI